MRSAKDGRQNAKSTSAEPEDVRSLLGARWEARLQGLRGCGKRAGRYCGGRVIFDGQSYTRSSRECFSSRPYLANPAANRFIESQLFPAHLPQRQDAFAADSVLLAAMDHARLDLQPDADMRGKA